MQATPAGRISASSERTKRLSVAERVGFEPTDPRKGGQQISSLPHSTTLPPLRTLDYRESR